MNVGVFGRAVTYLMLIFPIPVLASNRVAVIVGANVGLKEDVRLRYAEDDARRVAETLADLGGFTKDIGADEAIILLRSPTVEQLKETFAAVQRRMGEIPDEKSIFLFFFSGHADRVTLHLRNSILTHDELRQTLHGMHAAIKLGIVDACQSGALAIGKGALPAAVFSINVRNDLALRGTVILTSSGADEVSQEARILSGSFFTHHLVSGLRGAADRDGDRRVSIEEAYRYAAVRTRLDTGGGQGPVINIDLNGRGWLFLTKIKNADSVLVFSREEQRCYITDAEERSMVVEFVSQMTDRSAQIAVSPGEYILKCEAGEKYRVARIVVRPSARVEVALLKFYEEARAHGPLKGRLLAENPEQSMARRLAAESEVLRTEQPELIETSVLIALESLRRWPTLEVAQQALRRGLERLPVPRRCLAHDAAVTGVAWDPEGGV